MQDLFMQVDAVLRDARRIERRVNSLLKAFGYCAQLTV